MDHEELRDLLKVLSEAGWQRATLATDDFTLTLGETATSAATAPSPVRAVQPANTTAQPAPAPAEPAVQPQEVAAAAPVHGTAITAPSVGVAWRSPKPGAAPFVEVGQRVQVGETVALLEVMKLFTPITSDVTGTIVSIEVTDGQTVAFGTPIVVVASE